MSEDIAELGLRVNSLEVRLAERDLERFGNESNRTSQRVGLLNSALKLMAAAFAAIKLAKLVEETALLNARFETMGVVMNVAGNNAGYTSAQMADLEKELTKTGISMIKARENLTSLATANIDLSKATKLARAAQDLAVVGNTNSSEAFSRLTQGIKSGEVEVLRTLGLNVNFENSYKKLASQLGTTSDKLSEQQKVQARTNATLDAAARYTGIYEESMGTAGKQIQSLTRYVEDAKVKIGELFNESLTFVVGETTKALKAANAELDRMGQSGGTADAGHMLAVGFQEAFKAVSVFGANVLFVLNTLGREIGGFGAILAQVFVAPLRALNGLGAALDLALAGNFSGAADRAKSAFNELGQGIDNVKMIWEDLDKQGEASRAALDAYEVSVMGATYATKQQTQAEKEAADAKEQQRIAAAAAAAAQADADAKAAVAREAAAKALKKLQEESASFYKSTMENAKDQIAVLQAELNGVRELTSAEQKRIEVLNELDRMRKGLTKAQAAQIESDQDAIVWLDNLNEAIKANKKARADQVSAAQKDIDTAIETTRGLQEQVTYYGKTTDAVLRLQAAQMDHEIAQAQFRGDDIEIERLQILQSETIKQADLQLKLNKMKAATTFWTDLESAAHQTFLSIADGNKDLWTRMKDTAKNVFFEWLYQQTLKKWIINLSASSDSSGLSSIASAFSGGGSSGGGSGMLGTASNLFSIGKTIYQGFSTGLAASMGTQIASLGNLFGSQAVSAFGTGMTLTTSQAGTAASAYAAAGNSAAAGGLTAGAGAAGAVPIIGWIIAGMMANNAYFKQGWQMDGQKSDIAESLFKSTAKGNFFGPLLGSASVGIGAADKGLQKLGLNDQMASLISGSALWTRAFGHQKATVESQGLRGTINAGGIDAENYANILQKGGWFRSNKRNVVKAGLNNETDAEFDGTIKSMITAVKGFGKVLGLEATTIDGYTKAFDIKFTGKADEDNAAVAKLFADVGDELSLRLVPGLAKFAAQGESASATLQRLANDYMTVDNIMASMGVTIGKTGLAGIQLREELIAAAGGLDALGGGLGYFQNAFLTDAEKLAPVQKSLAAGLAELGISSSTTAEQFKAAVLGFDWNREGAAQLYVKLLELAPAMDQVSKATEAATAKTTALNDQIFDLTHTTAEVQERQRAAELVGLSEVDAALQKRIWQLRDEAAAAEVATQQQAAWMEAQDAITRANITANQAIKQAQQDYMQSVGNALVAGMKAAAQAAKELQSSLNGLLTGGLSPLSDQSKYDAAKAAFQRASTSDPAAYSAAGNSLLQASQSLYGAGSYGYALDYSAIVDGLQKGIESQLYDASGVGQRDFYNSVRDTFRPADTSSADVVQAVKNMTQAVAPVLQKIATSTSTQADLTDQVTQGGRATRTTEA